MAMAGLIVLAILLPDLPVPYNRNPLTSADTSWLAEWRLFLDTSGKTATAPRQGQALVSQTDRLRSNATMFYFDPNTLDEDGWTRLGLREKTAQTILNYRNKGGRFRKPEDLSRVYGLFPDEYERIKPYIRIATDDPASNGEKPSDTPKKEPSASPWTKKPAPSPIDINLADSIAWESLPGIGPKLAQRILRFRDALGGFHSIDQVGETFGLADSVFQKIKPLLVLNTNSIRVIHMNHVTMEELSAHPYFSKSLAGRITRYREQHGAFRGEQELKKVYGVNDSLLRKWRPYISFDITTK